MLKVFAGEIEKVGKISVGDQIGETYKRFINITNYGHYVNAIDGGYVAEGAFYNGYIHKINTPQFNLVIRGQYGNDCGFKTDIIAYRGNKYFIPNKR